MPRPDLFESGPQGASAQAHVLLVDDEVSALDISSFILRQNGYAVSMASNGFDALVMLNGSMNGSNPVDLVITDLTMPVMSGVDFVLEMRKRDFSTPVVVATGCLESYSEPEIKSMGADQILFKPFNPANLTDCVKTILARKEIGQNVDHGWHG
ncbi:MAG: response regulator [Lentisphaerae bacterium]|nr:response regulator [Lentisphaerota bacterium]